jgi:hypothetical protein
MKAFEKNAVVEAIKNVDYRFIIAVSFLLLVIKAIR